MSTKAKKIQPETGELCNCSDELKQIIREDDHCTRGPIERVRCTNCGKIISQKIIR